MQILFKIRRMALRLLCVAGIFVFSSGWGWIDKVKDSLAERAVRDCCLSEESFAKIERCQQVELLEMAECAASAYPRAALPSGYRPISRSEWDACTANLMYGHDAFDDNGYFILGNGLRARLMRERWGGRLVVAWSGCDLSGRDLHHGIADAKVCIEHWLSGSSREQYRQAADLMSSILQWHNGDVWVVGHSLGGCLTTYLYLVLPERKNIRFATFNGYGAAKTMVARMSSVLLNKQYENICNVHCVIDPVFSLPRTIHYGRVLYLNYSDKDPHGIGSLVVEMRKCIPSQSYGCLILLIGIVLLLASCIFFRARIRGCLGRWSKRIAE